MNTFYINKLVEELKLTDFSAMLLSPGEELNFLLGFDPMFCERFQGLFVKSDGGKSELIFRTLTGGPVKY